jgi:hypothetical protein
MPFVGLGLHLLIAIFFAVHAVRTGQPLFWLIILFSFPLLGSIVYLLVVYLPNSRLERGARRAVSVAAKVLDPTRELREARSAFEYTPTAQNQMRLAAALLEAGQAEEAAANYEACLKGPFATDLEIRLGAARAHYACGRHPQAVQHLETIRSQDRGFRAEQISLLLAQSLAGAGRGADAKAEFEAALIRFGGFEVMAEYAVWAAKAGDKEVLDRLRPELERTMQRWRRQTRELNAPLLQRLNAALAAAR